MAKKWKTGVEYTFKDREGFENNVYINENLAVLLSDKFTVLEMDGNNFCIVKTEHADRVNLPCCVIESERKFFKRVK